MASFYISNRKSGIIALGIANMYKKYRRQDGDPGWLGYIAAIGDPVTSVLPLGRHASTSPILSQRFPGVYNSCN